MTRRWGTIAVLVVVVLLAGCAGVLSGTDGGTSTPNATASTTPTSTATTTASPTPTPVPVDEDNPYGTETLVVYVVTEAESEIPFETAVDEALSFWAQRAETYADYPISFGYTDSADDADITITLLGEVESVEECGSDDETNVLGCATQPVTIAGNESVYVEDGYRFEDTVHVLKHEVGHALGLGHDDGPDDVMAARYESQPLSAEYTYDVDAAGSYHPGSINNQVEGGLGYLAAGGDGTVGTDVSFVRQRSGEVDIRIDVTGEEGACGGNLVCWELAEDGETFVVTTENVKEDAVGWVVAFATLRLLDADGYTDGYPDALDADGDTDPTKTWWR